MGKHSSGQALKLCGASLYINNEVHCFPTLAVNSTQKIHNSTTLQQWFYMVLCPLQWYTINEVWLLAHKDEVSWFHPTPVSVWSVGDQVNLWKIKESPYRTNESFPPTTYCGATFDWSAHSRPNRMQGTQETRLPVYMLQLLCCLCWTVMESVNQCSRQWFALRFCTMALRQQIKCDQGISFICARRKWVQLWWRCS